MRDAPAPAGSGKARIRAKQRAFSFKSSFMTSIAERALVSRIERYSLPIPSNQTLSEFLRQQMSPYIGRNVDDIVLRLGISKSDSKPARAGSSTAKMVGAEGRSVDTIEQFRKANVTKLKTVVLYPDGLPKESMSFRQITEEEWRGLASFDAKWEDSFLYEYFGSRTSSSSFHLNLRYRIRNMWPAMTVLLDNSFGVCRKRISNSTSVRSGSGCMN